MTFSLLPPHIEGRTAQGPPRIRSADAEAWFAAGQQAWQDDDPGGAAEALKEALALAPSDPMIEFALGCALLRSGDLLAGFPHYNRWRQREAGRKAAPRLPIQQWTGESVADRHVLIWGEDGFGDQIMYLRYAIELRRRGALVSWVCHPALERLMQSCGIVALRNDQSFTISDADYYCPSSNLPVALQETFERIQGGPYLHVREPIDTGKSFGVMTFSAPHHADGSQKTLPPAQADRLLSNARAVNLDPKASGASDFYETARIISGAQLVITVDTATAHLAGALGVPVRIMLPKIADWRWFSQTHESPWYNSAKLIRQKAQGVWDDVVSAALDEMNSMQYVDRPIF